jgi:hypothetical protein
MFSEIRRRRRAVGKFDFRGNALRGKGLPHRLTLPMVAGICGISAIGNLK